MKEINLLLVEDKVGDARLIREAFNQRTIKYSIDVAKDGTEATDYIFKRGHFTSALTPDIIILDIKLPKKDGKAVLKEIKSSVSLMNIPVIMLTNSDMKSDILESYEHQANAYITKPLTIDGLIEVVEYIEDTWLKSISK